MRKRLHFFGYRGGAELEDRINGERIRSTTAMARSGWSSDREGRVAGTEAAAEDQPLFSQC